MKDILIAIGFWAFIIVCGSALFWELVSGGQKKFWKYRRANRKNRASKYAGSCQAGQL